MTADELQPGQRFRSPISGSTWVLDYVLGNTGHLTKENAANKVGVFIRHLGDYWPMLEGRGETQHERLGHGP